MEERNTPKIEDLENRIDVIQEQIRKLWENLKVIMFYLHINLPEFRDFTDRVLKDETLVKKIK